MSDVIALIFDFDDTLAPDSTSGFLETIGVDTQQFWTKRVDPLLAQDWDPVPAYLHQMGPPDPIFLDICPVLALA